MSRRTHSVPSQRLTLSLAASLTREPVAAPKRSWWWLVGIVVVGWAILSYPTLLLTLLGWILMTDPAGTGTGTSSVVVGILGILMALCMAAAPVFTGFGVVLRRKIWWILAATMWAITIAALIYLVVAWIAPSGWDL